MFNGLFEQFVCHGRTKRAAFIGARNVCPTLQPHDLDHIFGWVPPYPTPCGFNTIDHKQYINTVDQTQYINKPTTSTCPTAQAG